MFLQFFTSYLTVILICIFHIFYPQYLATDSDQQLNCFIRQHLLYNFEHIALDGLKAVNTSASSDEQTLSAWLEMPAAFVKALRSLNPQTAEKVVVSTVLCVTDLCQIQLIWQCDLAGGEQPLLFCWLSVICSVLDKCLGIRGRVIPLHETLLHLQTKSLPA